MVALHELWQLGEASFRAIVDAQMRRAAFSVRRLPPLKVEREPVAAEVAEKTIAEAIHASPENVWPWLCQFLRGGGLYGAPMLEFTCPRSADRPLSALPPPRVGDRLGDVLSLTIVERGRRLCWRTLHGVTVCGHPLDWFELDFLVEPAGLGWTRLSGTVRGAGEELTDTVRNYALAIVALTLVGMPLATLRGQIETWPRRQAFAAPAALECRSHQAVPFIPVESA